MGAAEICTTPRLDRSFENRPIERIRFYIFSVLNNDGHPFKWFAKSEDADIFIGDYPTLCKPLWVLIEVE